MIKNFQYNKKLKILIRTTCIWPKINMNQKWECQELVKMWFILEYINKIKSD